MPCENPICRVPHPSRFSKGGDFPADGTTCFGWRSASSAAIQASNRSGSSRRGTYSPRLHSLIFPFIPALTARPPILLHGLAASIHQLLENNILGMTLRTVDR
jgi:hypothetical protein